jgi:hypothetical protein
MLTQNVILKYLSFVSLALILSSCGTVTETQMNIDLQRITLQELNSCGVEFIRF